MKDPRIEKLAYNLINYSVKLQKGEKLLIENFGLQRELVNALVKEAYAGWLPIRPLKGPSSGSRLINGCSGRTIQDDG